MNLGERLRFVLKVGEDCMFVDDGIDLHSDLGAAFPIDALIVTIDDPNHRLAVWQIGKSERETACALVTNRQ